MGPCVHMFFIVDTVCMHLFVLGALAIESMVRIIFFFTYTILKPVRLIYNHKRVSAYNYFDLNPFLSSPFETVTDFNENVSIKLAENIKNEQTAKQVSVTQCVSKIRREEGPHSFKITWCKLVHFFMPN